jgi:[ribosomal protein S18]-alanine N-acetyltransferase
LMRKDSPMPETATSIHIRWMISRDIADVVRIEEDSFAWDAWTEEDFLRCFRQRNCIAMVAELGEDERPFNVGFMVYEFHKTYLEVLNFAVAPRYRRLGVGGELAAKLIGKLEARRRRRIVVNVRETNLMAQLFFRAQGFRAARVLRRFYETTGEDAYRMCYRYREEENA